MNGNKHIGFTCSTFDLLHAGHIAMLREAKEHCDYLIVGLQTDPTIDRPESKQDLIDILEMYHINVRVLGEEYKELRDFTGKDVCRKRGIELHFNKREHRFSTTDLRERVLNAPTKKSKSSDKFGKTT